MQKNSNRRGLALGAIFALVASLFVSAPAQAATDGANIGVYPVAENGTTSSAFVGTLVDDFPIYVQAKPGNTSLANTTVIFKVEKTAGTNMDVVVSASATATDMSAITSTSPSAPTATQGYMQAGSTSITVAAVVNASGVAHLNFKASSASGLASWSAVTLKVTAFQDIQGGVSNDTINSDEWFTTQSVTLLHPTALTAVLSNSALGVGTNGVTVSATVTGVNLANISGQFRLAYSTSASTSFVGNNVTAAQAFARGGIVSQSAGLTTIAGNEKYEFSLRYHSAALSAVTDGSRVGSLVTVTASRATATALVVLVEAGDDAVSASGTTTSGVTYNVRPNKTYKVTVTAMSNSATVSGEALKVAITGESLSVDAGKTISIDGGAATTSYPTAMSLTTGTDGKASFTLASAGITDAHANFVITVTSEVSNLTKAATLNPDLPGFVVVNEYDLYSTTPGTAVKLNFDVEDQWGVASDRTNQRIKLTAGGDSGFQGNPTVSYATVTAGKASFDFTANPVTKTGSATIVPVVQTLNPDTNTWVDGTTGTTITIKVTTIANAFTGSALATASASISYAAASGKYSWSATSIAIKAVNPGSDVVVSAPGLFIQDLADSKTYSATATLRTDSSGDLSLKFASTKAGTHTVSFTVGTVTTTSQIVVTAAQVQSAKNITIASATMLPGQTNVISGTLTDANGNPVATTADKKVSVEWTGKGLPFNVGSIATDEDGKFSFQVLVLAGETGTGTVKATFKPTAVAADDITVTKTIAIDAPAVAPAPEVNAVIGTFNGRWAVRVENAKGAVVAVKVGGNWYKYTSLNENYLFSRKSAVGRSVAVAVYVNGTLENVATITIK
ncbi:hypothetical protein [Aquiluna sp. KACHI24]|uniref:hypothetical protein n=1 Tax=Aquiluna sp. KACHI24 TaxID=2968831 RepID=UPI0021FE5747|nr:hypothetical protein [Aquiluna sp. KACHI24]BDP99798.1 hypothetical protein AKACHI_01350 [Aquiluna sp. KACHI24]